MLVLIVLKIVSLVFFVVVFLMILNFFFCRNLIRVIKVLWLIILDFIGVFFFKLRYVRGEDFILFDKVDEFLERFEVF